MQQLIAVFICLLLIHQASTLTCLKASSSTSQESTCNAKSFCYKLIEGDAYKVVQGCDNKCMKNGWLNNTNTAGVEEDLYCCNTDKCNSASVSSVIMLIATTVAAFVTRN